MPKKRSKRRKQAAKTKAKHKAEPGNQEYEHPLLQGIRRMKGKLFYLLLSLLLLLFMQPFLQGQAWQAAVLNFFFTGILIAGVYVVSFNQRQFVIALLLGIPALTIGWADLVMKEQSLGITPFLFGIPFYIFTILSILIYILKAKRVTPDTFFGAISVYLLLGILFTSLFSMLETIAPGSVQLEPAVYGMRDITWTDLVYFSFTSLTTLGFGDVVPVTPHAQTLAYLEAATGVLYVALLIARLVGIYSLQATTRKE